MQPRLTFIVPAYNVEAYIEDCVLSIVNQTCRNIEIVVVDDGSTDGTPGIVDSLALNDTRIRVIHKENKGVSAARNTGLAEAKGAYVAFVDGDDYIAPDYADYMLGLVKHSDADFGLSLNCYTAAVERQIKDDVVMVLTPEEATALLLGPKVIVGCWNKIYKTAFLKDNDLLFPENLFYGEGLYFINQTAQRANHVAVGQRKVYYYRRNNYASACTRFNIQNFINGEKSIDEIERRLSIRTKQVLDMLAWHRCQFKMGAVVRMKSASVISLHPDYYKSCLNYVRANCLKTLRAEGVSLYKKGLIIGTAISPTLMARLDMIRRKRLQRYSVADYRNILPEEMGGVNS